MSYRKLIYEEKVPANIRKAFVEKVISISEKLKINPDWLMLVMKKESGFNPYAQATKPFRKKGQPIDLKLATGLIQFMPDSAKELGTTTTALANMDAIPQLDWVYKYYSQPYLKKKGFNSFYDLYLATFFPIAMGEDSSFVLQTKKLKASRVAEQNPAIRKFSDNPNHITVGAFKKYTDNALKEAGISKDDVTKKDLALKISTDKKFANTWLIAVPIIAGIGLYWWFVMKNKEL